MKYIRDHRHRVWFLLVLAIVALVWPFLANERVSSVGELLLYAAGLAVPASVLFLTRKRIVRLIEKHKKVLFSKLVRGFAITMAAAWVVIRIGLAIVPNIRLLILIWFSFLPIMGGWFLGIKQRFFPVLVMMATFLSPWDPLLSGALVSVSISIAVIPNEYPLTLQELLAKEDVSDLLETDCLYYYTQTGKRDEIIPAIEDYIAKRTGSKFLGYHYLLHMSHSLESEAELRQRALQAEAALGIDEFDILFPAPVFRIPDED